MDLTPYAERLRDELAVSAEAAGPDARAPGERAETVVDVEPNDASDAEDRKAAELTRVEYANGGLLVRAPKARSWIPRRSGGSISVTIELPAGSHLRGSAGVADFHADGPLGDCVIETGVGRIQ